jgi:hypothetical protein
MNSARVKYTYRSMCRFTNHNLRVNYILILLIIRGFRLSVCLCMALQSFFGPWPIFRFLILYTVGRTPWTGDQPVARPLPTHGTTQTQNKHIQTSMPLVGFEPTIPAFERAKTVHALDRAATVIGFRLSRETKFSPTPDNWESIVYQGLSTRYAWLWEWGNTAIPDHRTVPAPDNR